MRSFLLAALAVVAIPACTEDLAGGGGGTGDDTQSGPKCGDGHVDTGEACDDGNTNNGDGCSSTCTTESSDTARIALTSDMATQTVDLNGMPVYTLTATSMGGFTGTVTLAPVADAADWTATLDTTTLTLTDGGTATAKLTVNAMGDTAALTGNVKVSATYSGPAADVSVAATFNPVLDVKFGDDGTGTAVYDANHLLNNPFNLKAGRSIKVINGSATATFRVHTNAVLSGFPHQPDTSPAGGFYMGTTNATDIGQTEVFYTHPQGASPAFLNDPGIQNAQRPHVKVVQ
ncbi:MAG: myxococcus cysteine-rich repeat containing protein [Kofleriaceae bacterium]